MSTPIANSGIAKSEHASREKLNHDALTGLLNREGLDAELHDLIRNQPGDFALFVIDLNDVKKTNDTKGHASGDELLMRVRDVFNNTLRHSDGKRPSDIVALGREQGARTGGDEFVLLAPGVADEAGLQAVSQRLRGNFQQAGISAAIGGWIHEIGMSQESLLHSADSEMYADKQEQKLSRYEAGQLEVIEHIGSVALTSGIDPNDIAPVLRALREQSEQR